MSTKTRLLILSVFGAFIIHQPLLAQSSSSTYSSIGMGEFNNSGFTQNQGMGGLGISYGNSFGVNHVNPALSVQNYAFNFQAAINYERINASSAENSADIDGGGLGYVAMSFPIKPSKMSLGLGLNQVSSVNYNLTFTNSIPNSTNTATSVINGDGGISEAYLSTGFQVAKNLNLGIQASYIFGSTIRRNVLTLKNEQGANIGEESEYYERLTVNDLSIKGGAHYMAKVGNRKFLHFGTIYQVFGELNAKEFSKMSNQGQASNPDAPGDILSNDLPGTIYLPNRLGYGITYERLNKFMIGLEAQHQNFSTYRSFNGATGELNNSFKVGLGGQYIPDLFSMENVFARSMYRLGFEYEQMPYLVQNTAINDLGISFGASIPMNNLSLMNLAFKLGTRGSADNNLVRENYIRVSLGFSINDNSWFYKKVFE
ncbi:hypothetical protein [Anditalea andensis]|uniref:Outer membrane protein n=1 Tax=Anditalea andensis TaxID=1048983 RepID=A0A074KW75_9BACT|nr:hypothetical protein [Anditalea andensis]KEO73164.1 hypothetical protein EL17_12460 [Anditalea andensis]